MIYLIVLFAVIVVIMIAFFYTLSKFQEVAKMIDGEG